MSISVVFSSYTVGVRLLGVAVGVDKTGSEAEGSLVGLIEETTLIEK